MNVRTRQLYVLSALVAAAGAVGLIVGYAGIRGEADVALQLPYILSGGLGGLFLLGAGVGLFLAATLSDLRVSQGRLEAEVADLTTEVRTLLDHAEIEVITDEEP